MIDKIVTASDLHRGGSVVLLVNGLGGTPAMELAIVAHRAVLALEERGMVVERLYLGNFLTALEMAGVSLSVLEVDASRLARLDAPTEAPAWPSVAGRPHGRSRSEAAPIPKTSTEPEIPQPPKTETGHAIEAALRRAAEALIAAEPSLTAADQAVGDGDLGISLTRGARAILDRLPRLPLDDPAATLLALGTCLEDALGGTSGPLYAAFFLRAGTSLTRQPNDWAAAFENGCAGMSELGGASRGDRTMLDALLPASDAFSQAVRSGIPTREALPLAAKAAREGAAATSAMKPRRGRSSYLGERAIGYTDPGAEAVVVWLEAIIP
jgi:dihydroxyacetone kinase